MNWGLMQLVAYGAQDVYSSSRYDYNKCIKKNKKKFEGKNNFYKKVKNSPKHNYTNYKGINFTKPKPIKNDFVEQIPKIVQAPKVRQKQTQKISWRKRNFLKKHILLKLSIGNIFYYADNNCEMKNTECPILCEPIKFKYTECVCCKYCFDYNTIATWNKNECPMCRSNIKTRNVKYINMDKANIYNIIKSEIELIK